MREVPEMNRLFAERIAGIPWVLLALVAGLIALAYAVLPGGQEATGATFVILRWAHSVAWLFFAAAAFARALPPKPATRSARKRR